MNHNFWKVLNGMVCTISYSNRNFRVFRVNSKYTAISRKFVKNKVHATIPKGNMGYDQYLFLTTVAVEPTFVTFLQHSQTYISGLPYDSFKFLWKTVHLKSPTIPFRIVACTFSDNLSQNSCIPLVSSAKTNIEEMSESWVPVTPHCGLHSTYSDRYFKMARWGELKLSWITRLEFPAPVVNSKRCCLLWLCQALPNYGWIFGRR